MASKCASGKTAPKKCGTTKSKNTKAAAKPKAQTKKSCGTKKKQVSYGMKPYMVHLPNEPNPLSGGRENSHYIYRGGDEADPRSYENFKGISFYDAIVRWAPGLRADLKGHSFRSKQTMINWFDRKGVAVSETPEGLFFHGHAYGTPKERAQYKERDLHYYNGWVKGDVYAIAYEDDPNISEPFGETTVVEHPRDLPPGAKYVTAERYDGRTGARKFYGDDAKEYIQKEIENAERPENRKYIFRGKVTRMMGFDDLVAIRPDARNLNIDGEMYLNFKGTDGTEYSGLVKRVK